MPSLFSQLGWLLRRQVRKVWVKVTSFALFGLATAVAAYFLKGFIPDDLSTKVGVDAIESILNVLATSMLTVTTFSLSILTAAFANAANNSSPRAVSLLVEDGFSQTVLATFIGAFVFSIVGITLLPTGVYGDSGRLILFAATLLVVLIVVLALLRWISSLIDLGRVGDNLDRLEKIALQSLKQRLEKPACGANVMMTGAPVNAVPICPKRIGYIQHIGYAEMSVLAEKSDLYLYLDAQVGDFVTPGAPIFHICGADGDTEKLCELGEKLLLAYAIDKSRSFEQDPRFGISVLSEVGQRALSPAVNDPGTAREVIARITRVLGHWKGGLKNEEPDFPRLWAWPLSPAELLDLGLAPLARDGGGNFDLQLSLQRALLALAQINPTVLASPAAELSRLALVYSDAGIPVASQRDQLSQLSQQVIRLESQITSNS